MNLTGESQVIGVTAKSSDSHAVNSNVMAERVN